MTQTRPSGERDEEPVGHIETINRYPIKSVGGHTVQHAHVDVAGLLGDRQFAFLDVESGNLANAKHPRKFGGLLACTATYVAETRPGEPLPVLEVHFPDGSRARNDGPDLDAAMSRHLDREVRLVSSVPPGARNEILWLESLGLPKESLFVDAVEDEYGDHVTSFAQQPNAFVDAAPLHLLTTSTVEHFRALDPTATFDARRYRPSMVLRTPQPGLVEDAWTEHRVRLGNGVVGEVLMATPRCVMSTVEHAPDLPQDRRTLQTIVRHNTKVIGGTRWGCAGVYTNVIAIGAVAVGDPVHVSR